MRGAPPAGWLQPVEGEAALLCLYYMLITSWSGLRWAQALPVPVLSAGEPVGGAVSPRDPGAGLSPWGDLLLDQSMNPGWFAPGSPGPPPGLGARGCSDQHIRSCLLRDASSGLNDSSGKFRRSLSSGKPADISVFWRTRDSVCE